MCQGSNPARRTRRTRRKPVLAITRMTPPMLTGSVGSIKTTATRPNQSGGRQVSSDVTNASASSRRVTGSCGVRRSNRDAWSAKTPRLKHLYTRATLPTRMVYPRRCPSCGRDEPSPDQLYSTRAAMDGGTPSPWRPEQPGRILDLRCGACWALFRWDYFGSRLLEIIKEGDPEAVSEALRDE